MVRGAVEGPLRNATHRGAAERTQMTIAQQQHAIHAGVHACHVVRGEEDRSVPGRRELSRRRAIDEQQYWPAGIRRYCRCGQRGGQAAMHGEMRGDGTGIRAASARDALEQGGLPRSASAHDGHALAKLDAQRAAPEHPRARGAAANAGRIALPDILDAEGGGHDQGCIMSLSPSSSNVVETDQNCRQRGRARWKDAMASARTADPNLTVSVVGRPVSRRTVSTARYAASSSRS
jgi:hypothetical protein